MQLCSFNYFRILICPTIQGYDYKLSRKLGYIWRHSLFSGTKFNMPENILTWNGNTSLTWENITQGRANTMVVGDVYPPWWIQRRGVQLPLAQHPPLPPLLLMKLKIPYPKPFKHLNKMSRLNGSENNLFKISLSLNNFIQLNIYF